jgi:hypothetical protein
VVELEQVRALEAAERRHLLWGVVERESIHAPQAQTRKPEISARPSKSATIKGRGRSDIVGVPR